MLTGVTFDALNPVRLQSFWAAATEGGTDGLVLRFEQATGPKTGKNRLHLDLAGGARWRTEVDRLMTLGARRVDIGQGDVPWDVLADPEGNEFCVLRSDHPGVGGVRGLAAVCLDMAADVRPAQSAFWRRTSGWAHVDEFDWGLSLRRGPTSSVALVMGPPAAPKHGRNRLRLDVLDPTQPPGEHVDPGGNEYRVHHGAGCLEEMP